MLASLVLSLLLTACSDDRHAAETVHAIPVSGFDIVINNGRVMDPESNFDEVRNVGKIATITEVKITGLCCHAGAMEGKNDY